MMPKSNMVPPPIVKTGKRIRMDLDISKTMPAKVAIVANETEEIPIICSPVIPHPPVQDSLLSEFNLLREELKKRDHKDMEDKKESDAEVKKLRTDHYDLTTRLNEEINFKNNLIDDYKKQLQKLALITQNQQNGFLTMNHLPNQQVNQPPQSQSKKTPPHSLTSVMLTAEATTSANLSNDNIEWIDENFTSTPANSYNKSTSAKPQSNFSYINKRIPEFSGKPQEDFDAWVTASKKFLKQFRNMTDVEKADNISMGVVGDASQVLEALLTLNKNVLNLPESLFEALKVTYGTRKTVEEMMNTIKQQKDESVRSYFGRVQARLLSIFKTNDSIAYDSALISYFKNGLSPKIQQALFSVHPSDVDATLQCATQIETDFAQANLLSEKEEPLYNIRTIETSSTSVDTHKDQKNTSRNQGKSDNYDSPHKRSVRIECYNCHKRGHSLRNCFTASKDQKEAIQKNLLAIKAKYDA